MDKLKSIYASARSAALAIVIVTAITIGAELSAPFKSWLAAFTGHHWITKSWLSFIAFVLLYGVFRMATPSVTTAQTRMALVVLEMTAIAGFLALLGFFTYEFFVE